MLIGCLIKSKNKTTLKLTYLTRKQRKINRFVKISEEIKRCFIYY